MQSTTATGTLKGQNPEMHNFMHHRVIIRDLHAWLVTPVVANLNAKARPRAAYMCPHSMALEVCMFRGIA